jgi:peptide/nickel transport system substrate-binding protein
VLAAVALVVFAGASAASEASTKGDSRSISGAALTWVKNGEVTGLDPQINGQQTSWDILYRVYEPLVQLGENGTIEPWLAASWKQVSPTVYTFQLRHNVRFSNGRPMTPADVVASFNRVMNPKLGAFAASLLGIKKVVAEGAFAVRITLRQPSGVFLPQLTQLAASILPGKELKSGAFNPAKSLLGTGPYEVAQHLQNQSWTLVRNPYYWRRGYPKFAKLSIQIVNDAGARMAALRSGRADVATFDDPDTPKLLSGTPNLRIVTQSTSDYYVLDLDASGGTSKMHNQQIRQAISVALDRQEIIKLALGGTGLAVAGAGTVPNLPDACSVKKYATPDPARAKDLLASANASGLGFAIEADNAYPIFGKIAQVIQAQLQQIGLNPRIDAIEDGAWATKVYTKGDFDASISFYTAGVDNWTGLWNWSPTTNGFTKAFQLNDPGLNALLKKSQAMPHGKKRAAVFARMCDLAYRDASTMPIATRTQFVAYRTDRVQPRVQTFESSDNTLRYVAEFAKK